MSQKRVEALSQMINTVKDSKKFKEDTIVKLTQARSQAKTGNVEQPSTILQATAEAYPVPYDIIYYAFGIT